MSISYNESSLESLCDLYRGEEFEALEEAIVVSNQPPAVMQLFSALVFEHLINLSTDYEELLEEIEIFEDYIFAFPGFDISEWGQSDRFINTLKVKAFESKDDSAQYIFKSLINHELEALQLLSNSAAWKPFKKYCTLLVTETQAFCTLFDFVSSEPELEHVFEPSNSMEGRIQISNRETGQSLVVPVESQTDIQIWQSLDENDEEIEMLFLDTLMIEWSPAHEFNIVMPVVIGAISIDSVITLSEADDSSLSLIENELSLDMPADEYLVVGWVPASLSLIDSTRDIDAMLGEVPSIFSLITLFRGDSRAKFEEIQSIQVD